MAQDIARLYQQCDPARPLQPGDPRYIPFEGVRGEGDLIAQLTNALRWSDVPLQVLFAGVFSPKATALVNVFGRRPDVLPMVKIVQSNGTDDPAGMDAMRAIVQRRLAAAQVPKDTAFDTDDTLDYVCR